MSTLNPAMIDMLTTQYVWTIQNESKWHAGAKLAYSNNDHQQFARVCWEWIRKVAISRHETLTFDLMNWTVGELCRQFVNDQTGPVPTNFIKYLKQDIDDHTAKAEALLNSVQEELNSAIFITKEPDIMANKLFETKQYIGGVEVNNLTEAQLIQAIKTTEDQITGLKQIKTESKKIAANIAEMEADLARVVAVLDAR